MSLPALDLWWFHAGACLVAGALAWSLGIALHRGLRISHAARGYWLFVWGLAILPTLSAIAFHWFAPTGAVLPLPAALPLGIGPHGWSSGLGTPRQAAGGSSSAQAWLPLLLSALYLAGVGLAALRWSRGMLAIRRIVRASRPFAPAAPARSGPLLALERQRLHGLGIELRSTADPVSPFAVCWPRRAIVIPSELAARLDDRQLQMVLRHEASHLACHDPQRAMLMRLVGVVFWFNPFLALIERRVQLAAELCCDAAAAGGEPDARRVYAKAYLEALRLSVRSRMPAPVAAFSRRDPGSHKLRIQHMVQGDARRRLGLPWRIALAASALAAGSAAAMVQVGTVAPPRSQAAVVDAGGALASAVPTPVPLRSAAARPEVTVDNAPGPAAGFRFPVAAPRINSPYGVEGGPRTRPHRGVDFAAARGTPVYAPADATVTAATTRYPDGANYGTVVVLDHGGGWQSLYAHLDSFDVEVGQRVAAGMQIGRAGTTGKVTGPHLHMELLLDGQRVDPVPMLR